MGKVQNLDDIKPVPHIPVAWNCTEQCTTQQKGKAVPL